MSRKQLDERDASVQIAGQFAAQLRRRRDELAMSQEDVASRAGVSRYVYQMFEKGEGRPGRPANPQLRTMIALAQALDMPVASLIPADLPDLTTR